MSHIPYTASAFRTITSMSPIIAWPYFFFFGKVSNCALIGQGIVTKQGFREDEGLRLRWH